MRRMVAAPLLLAFAIGAAAAPPMAPPSSEEPPAPDLLFFAEGPSKLAHELHFRCASCHSDAETAGGFLLQPYDDLDRPPRPQLLHNYRAALRFLDPADPLRSPLVRKSLGEMNHGGGALYAGLSAKEVATLLDFALGATLKNLPPDAILPRKATGPVGEDLELDGTLSADRDGDPIGYRWSLIDRPDGSAAALADAESPQARLTPDEPGVYRVELRVHDGKLWSLPETLQVMATGRAASPPPSMEGEREGPPPASLFTGRLDSSRLRLVRRLHFDLKARGPTLEETAALLGRSHDDCVDLLLKEEETWQAWYEGQLYYFLLLDRFRPKDSPITTLPARLAKAEVGVPRALEEIVRSQFFSQRNPGNDTFVTVVLEQCLGMVVQKNLNVLEAGKKMYDGVAASFLGGKGNSQSDLVRIVFDQPACCEHLLRRAYLDLHGREPDKKMLAAEAARLREDPSAYATIVAGWLKAPAYTEAVARPRTKPEVPYVRALFLDVLGRLPTYEELRNVRNAFLSLADPTPIRLVMVRVLLESGEARTPASATDPERFVAEQFVRLLARAPSAKETDTFVQGLRNDPRVTPRLVLWTLLSSSEYQTY
ncbi:MAG: hypothetical protein ACT4PV_13930 [Planctomycetaceae bacterium]